MTVGNVDFSHLDIDEKIILRAQLEESIAAELDAARHLPLAPELLAELDRRSAAVHAGTATLYTWEEVKASLEQDDL
jgi:putative addiction module component (TIGR02574 family)